MLNAKTLNRNTDTVWTERDPRSEAENMTDQLSRLEFTFCRILTSSSQVTFSSLPMIRAVGSLLSIAFSQSNKDTELRRFVLLLLEALVRQPRSPLMQQNAELAQIILNDWLPCLGELLGSKKVIVKSAYVSCPRL